MNEFSLDYPVKAEIKKVKGKAPRYDVWTVQAEFHMVKDGEEFCRRTVQAGMLKDRGAFEENLNGVLNIVAKLKNVYKKKLKEDPEYQEYVSETLESEKTKADEIEGSEFEV